MTAGKSEALEFLKNRKPNNLNDWDRVIIQMGKNGIDKIMADSLYRDLESGCEYKVDPVKTLEKSKASRATLLYLRDFYFNSGYRFKGNRRQLCHDIVSKFNEQVAVCKIYGYSRSMLRGESIRK